MALFTARLLAGLAAAGLTITVAGAPAFAAPDADVEVAMFVPNVTTAAGSAGAQFSPVFWATAAVALEKPVITYRLTGNLPGVSLAEPEEGADDCQSVSATELKCSSSSPLELGPDGLAGQFDALVVATAAATIDATGVLSTTLTSGTLEEPVTETSQVRVGESVDLKAPAPAKVTAGVGKAFEAPLGVTNAGTKAITGSAVLIFNDWAIEPGEQYSNCYYAERELRACEFEQELAPAKTYGTTLPSKVRADTMAPGSAYGETVWLTAAELEDQVGLLDKYGLEIGEPGDGPALTLHEVTAAQQRKAQADAHPEDNHTALEVTVTGANGVDLAAVGGNLKGATGAEITAKLGVRNVGTATLDRNRVGEPAAVTTLYVPAGVKVTDAPAECFPVNGTKVDHDKPGDPGHSKYDCYSEFVLAAGDDVFYEFGFRIDNAESKAGKIVINEPCECSRFTKDINKKNNESALTVNKKSTTGGTGAGNGDDDDTLPITGPATGGIAGTGLAMVALGVLAMVATRRRQVS